MRKGFIFRKFGKYDEKDFTIMCDYEFLDDSYIMYAPMMASELNAAKETSPNVHSTNFTFVVPEQMR